MYRSLSSPLPPSPYTWSSPCCEGCVRRACDWLSPVPVPGPPPAVKAVLGGACDWLSPVPVPDPPPAVKAGWGGSVIGWAQYLILPLLWRLCEEGPWLVETAVCRVPAKPVAKNTVINYPVPIKHFNSNPSIKIQKQALIWVFSLTVLRRPGPGY